MKFGAVPVGEAEGAILAHATSAGGKRLRKGTRLDRAEIDQLRAAGVETVIVAVLAADDLGEDSAATRIATALETRNIATRKAATGRVNLHADGAGVFTVDRALIDAINAVDPAITIATLAEFAPVRAGQMVATVKIIPFAVPACPVDEVVALCTGREVFAVQRFSPKRVALVQTRLPGIKTSVLDKTAATTRARLDRSGSTIVFDRRVPHEERALAAALGDAVTGSDMVLAFGASAVSDADDVIPAAIRLAGGAVERFGMPVDPGNLLVKGRIGDVVVLGAPGCARSPKENGFDWVLDRTIAGLDVSERDIAGMGVGGLLMEIASRPEPREKATRPVDLRPHAILMAAGRSSRMGGANKLLAAFDGRPLVRRSAERVVASRVRGTVAVLGHQAGTVGDALAGVSLTRIDNPDFADGLSTSIKAGLKALPADAAGALIVLADMPELTTADIDEMIAAFEQKGGRAVVRATHNGKRGNPVILPRALFGAVESLEGDTGARHLVESGLAEVIDFEIGRAATVDVDTPEAMRRAGGVLQD